MAETQSVAVVTSIVGKAYVRADDGTLVELKVGDVLQPGQVVITSAGGQVELDMGGSEAFTLNSDQTVRLTAEMFDSALSDNDDAAAQPDQFEQIVQTLEEGGDLDALMAAEAPAAGAAGGGDDGNSFVRLESIIEATAPVAFDGTQAAASSATEDDAADTQAETVVGNDAAVTDEDTPVVIDVLANDTDIDGPVSPVASVTDGANGSVTLNPDGTVTYTPNANYF
ncbi:MAG: retention module-containing protein, partial [Desulfuromonadaceae bacterium]|nr:retention module-containing protein [Desulfuromonadaceae bacterium]